MRALWVFGWLLAKMFYWEDVGFGGRDTGYAIVDDGQVEAQDGNAGGGPAGP